MESLYNLAERGALSEQDIRQRLSEIDDVHSQFHLTPLAVAVWKGHVSAAQHLLLHGANPNGAPNSRPPLWVAAGKTKQNAGQLIQILLDSRADPNLASSQEGDKRSTPLIMAVSTRKLPIILSLLVDAGASSSLKNEEGQSAEDIANSMNNIEALEAMRPLKYRTANRIADVSMIVGVILFAVAWANKNTMQMGGPGSIVILGAVERRFGLAGSFCQKFFKNPNNPPKPDNIDDPKAKAEVFTQKMNSFIEKNHLNRFFPPGDRFLEEIVRKAVMLDNDSENSLDVNDLIQLSLYQPILFCDDSGSMAKERRRENQAGLVQRISSITTRIIPDDEGVELRFINHPVKSCMSKPSMETIKEIMNTVPSKGWSEIGTNLEKKVLCPMVYTPLEDGTFKRPMLVSILTDGCPAGPRGTTRENENTLKEVILRCGETLRNKGYDRQVVHFQISQIGNDQAATNFLSRLSEDPDLKGVLYCTSDRLDVKFTEYLDNKARLEQWLLKLLLSPIYDAQPE